MKHVYIIQRSLLLLALSLTSTAQSQVSLQAGGGLGIIIPTADYEGSTIEYYSGTKYGLSTGFNLHGTLRIGLPAISLVGGLGYSSLSNEGNSEPGQGRVEVSQKIITLKAGAEYHFEIPASPVTPYVTTNLAINRFSGETSFQGVSRVSSATYVVNSAVRFGIGFGGGAIVDIQSGLSLDIGIQYNLMNVGGKSWEDVNPQQDQRIDTYLALNDGKDPLFPFGDEREHFVYKNRTIHTILFTVSVMFDLR